MNKRYPVSLGLTLGAVLVVGLTLTVTAHLAAEKLIKSKKPIVTSTSNKPTGTKPVQTPTLLEGQSATLLPNGNLLLIGGKGNDGPQRTIEILNVRTRDRTSLPNGLQQPRTGHSAVMLPDGTIMILGGIGSSGEVLNSVEVFDPVLRRSELLASSTVTPRAYHTATLLTDGRVLIVGGVSARGRTLGKAELWDCITKAVTVLPAKLNAARQKHKAMLTTDGSVLIEGGLNEFASAVTNAEQYDPEAKSFSWSGLSSLQVDSSAPYVAVSLPANDASDVLLDSHIALRFSKPLRVETVNSEAVKLTGPEGAVATKVVPAEGGMLAFITPGEPLQPGTLYTLTLNSPISNDDLSLPFTSLTFTTVGSTGTGNRDITAADDEEWIPEAKNLPVDWQSHRPGSTWQSLPPLQAAPGVTGVAGQVLKLNGLPLPNVTLEIDGTAARTDRSGRFLLSPITAGHHVLNVIGDTANRPGKTYGMFCEGIDVAAGQTNVLPYTIWMPLLDTEHATTLPVPTTSEVVATTPRIPGLEVHIPPNIKLKGMDGRDVTSISITPVSTDRPPFPLPSGVHIPVYFTLQPEGAMVEGVDGSVATGIRITYPNTANFPPGYRINFWSYDAAGVGWFVYGAGTVTPDGRQIVPDPGVGIYHLTCAAIGNPNTAPATGPAPCNSNCTDGDPVDLSTGLFVYRKTDLALPDVIPITLTRTYRQNDSTSRPFGIGATHPYEMFLVGDLTNFTYADLILPDGGRIHYSRTSPGTNENNALLEHTATPSAFYKSTLKHYYGPSNDERWDIQLKDGTLYRFGILFAQESVKLKLIQDRYGNSLTIARDNVDKITSITSQNGRWISFTYDASKRITQARDNAGRVVTYIYDASGRLWKVTDPNGGVTEHTYDAAHRMLTIKDARSIVYLTNQYDANGRVMKQTQADNSTYQFAYALDGNGKVTQTDVTNPRGSIRRATFNTSGYTLTDTYALGNPEQQTITYERQAGTNLLLSVTDALNRRTSYSYDGLGNATYITRLAGTPDAIRTSFTYEATFNQVTSVTDPLGRTSSLAHDIIGNVTSVTDALGHQTSFTYNAAGQLVSVTNPVGTMQYGYQGGDLTSTIDPLGRTVSRNVDSAGRVYRTTDLTGRITRYDYDSLNQLTRVTDPLGAATAFAYDPNGNLLSVSDARNNVTNFAYDNMDRLSNRQDPLLNSESYQYDAAGNLSQFTDRRGKVTTLSYDNINRRTFAGFGTTAGPAYESTVNYTYDAGNRFTQAVDSLSGTITRAYNNLNRLTSEITPQGTLSYTYDSIGRKSGMTVTGQSAVSYTYDNDDRLTTITQGTSIISFSYDAADRRTSLTLANGVVVEYDYDGASQLTGITYRNGTTVLGNLTYTYDNNGRRAQVGGSYARTGLASTLASTTHNAANQLTQRGATTFTYDANGNLQGDGTNTYTWNARDQLVSMTAPSLTASFQYDALGRRINKTINSVSTSYLYDGNNAVQELQGPTPVANMLNGGLDEAYARTDGDGARTLLSDGPGSTVALLDSTGTAQTQYTYEPFGNTTISGVSSSNPSQYTGRENDSTGLYYYRGRYYSPSLQRFISEDPIGIAGGINLYAYVNNNPITYRDPFGLDKDLRVRDFITDKIGGGVTLGGEVVNTTGVSYDNAVNRLTSMGFKPYWDPHPAHWGGMDYEGKVCGNWYHVTVGYPAKTYGGYYDLDDPWTFMQIHAHEWAPHNHLLEMLAKQFMRGPFDLGP